MGTTFAPPLVNAPPPGMGPWMRHIEKWIKAQGRVSSGRVGVVAADMAIGAVTFGAMAPQALDGFVITAPFLQSSNPGSGLPRYQQDQDGIHFYDSNGNVTIDFATQSGQGLITGSLKSGPNTFPGGGDSISGLNVVNGMPAELITAGYTLATIFYSTLVLGSIPYGYTFDAYKQDPGGTTYHDRGVVNNAGVVQVTDSVLIAGTGSPLTTQILVGDSNSGSGGANNWEVMSPTQASYSVAGVNASGSGRTTLSVNADYPIAGITGNGIEIIGDTVNHIDVINGGVTQTWNDVGITAGDVHVTGNLTVDGTYPGGGGGSSVPTGTIVMWPTLTAPSGWSNCDGSSQLRAGTYAALFALLGGTYGVPDSTHFYMPDFRSLVPVGLNTADAHFDNIGDLYGAATVAGAAHTHTEGSHTHTSAAHTHTVAAHSHTSAAHSHTSSAHTHTETAHTHTLGSTGWANLQISTAGQLVLNRIAATFTANFQSAATALPQSASTVAATVGVTLGGVTGTGTGTTTGSTTPPDTGSTSPGATGNTSLTTDSTTPGITGSGNGAGTGSTTPTATSVMQPSVAINFIIKL